MATAETMPRPQAKELFQKMKDLQVDSVTDRHSRRKPFTNWMKRLANLKSSSSEPNESGTNSTTSRLRVKKPSPAKNNPYLHSQKPNTKASVASNANGHLSFYTPPSGRSVNYGSPTDSKASLPASSNNQHPPRTGDKSAAPTVSTNPGTIHSEAERSKTGTCTTGGGTVASGGLGGGEGSTFSSPAPSVRSLTTTLTTIQSAAPSNLIAGANHHASQPTPTITSGHTHFSHQYPTSPPSAIPSHVAPPHSSGGHPATYSTATANNLLTDNASILTLASSSKRRRRNSLDTNASVRALAPSSLFGGSRESLPLSVLNSTITEPSSSLGPLHGRANVAGIGNAERASVYSSSGIAPALSSERNSYYANKQGISGDGGSIRSGLISHGRNDSTAGSIGGLASAGSPLASPREIPVTGRISRRNSGWGEVDEEDSEEEEKGEENTKASPK